MYEGDYPAAEWPAWAAAATAGNPFVCGSEGF